MARARRIPGFGIAYNVVLVRVATDDTEGTDGSGIWVFNTKGRHKMSKSTKHEETGAGAGEGAARLYAARPSARAGQVVAVGGARVAWIRAIDRGGQVSRRNNCARRVTVHERATRLPLPSG